MIEFASETARHCFHQLIVDEQLKWQKIAEEFESVGSVVTIVCVYIWGKDQSEINIRVDKKSIV